MPFVVDDIMFTYIVLPYGRRLLTEGQYALFDWLDRELGEEGRKLAKSLSKRKLTNNQVLEDLGHFVEERRGMADALAAAASAAELKAASDVKGDEELLEVVRDFFFAPIFEMVKSLGHRAVVPGFLTGADWLTVIDLRVPLGEKLEEMRVFPRIEVDQYWSSEVIPARIEVWTSPGVLAVPHWRPRIWLVVPAGEELADALDKRARDPYGTAQQFAEALEHQPFVTEITLHHVIVQHAKWLSSNSPDVTGKSVRIPWAGSPDGAKTMRAALAAQLGDRQEQQRRWIQALKN